MNKNYENFETNYLKLEQDVKDYITYCKELEHFQQVIYSVHGTCLTQICFICKKVNTNLRLLKLK